MASSSDEDASDSLFTIAGTDDPEKLIRVNFYIANDLPAFLREWLTTVIEARDGRVSNKQSDSFPARGYILVDPTTSEAGKLRRRHGRVSKKASLRHVVDWKFVPACLEARRIIKWDEIPPGDNVFQKSDEDDGWPVFIYPKGDKATLLRYAYQLSRHGAELVDNQAAANFIVCDPTARAYARLLGEYISDRSTFVVAPSWIAQSITSGRVKMTASQPNVSHPRQRGVPYTAAQDQHLVEYLAEVCPVDVPYVSSRLAMTVYNDLVANVTKYPWAKAHPAQSWRERYKKRRDELDPRIETLVAKRNRAPRKRKAPSGNNADQRSDPPAPKRAKLATPNIKDNVALTSGNREASNRSPADRVLTGQPTTEPHLSTPKNRIDKQLHIATAKDSPRASHGHSMPVPPRGHDAAKVYIESDDDGAPLPSDVANDPVLIEPQKSAKSPARMNSPVDQGPGEEKEVVPLPEEERITPDILVHSGEPALRPHAAIPNTAHGEHGQDTDHAAEQHEPRTPSHLMPSNADVPLSPANEEVSQTSCEMTQSDNHDGTNSHDPQPIEPNDDAALPSQTLKESAAEIPSSEEPASAPVPSTSTRVLRSRSISVQPPTKASSKSKGGEKPVQTEQPATLPQILEKSPAPGSDDAVEPGKRNGRRTKNRVIPGDRRGKQPAVNPNDATMHTRSRALRPLAPPAAPPIEFEDDVVDPMQETSGHGGNTDDEEEVEIVLSQAQPTNMSDEGSLIMEDGPVAAADGANDEYEAKGGIHHEHATDQPEQDDSPPRPRPAHAPLPPPLPSLRAKSPNADDNRSPSSIQRDAASPSSRHARAISVDYSPAAKDHRGAETQAIMEERERTVRAGRHALASTELDFDRPWSPGGHSSPIFKGKTRAQVSGDFDVDGPGLQEARHREPPLRRPTLPARTLPAVDAMDGRRTVPAVHLEGNGAPYQRNAHLPTSPRHSYRTSSISTNLEDEDSDEHFAGLDRIMARALRVLCKRYRFSAMDVRQKFELRNQDLASTKKVLEENRRLLDQDSLFRDFTQ